jgi:hypothetical protein
MSRQEATSLFADSVQRNRTRRKSRTVAIYGARRAALSASKAAHGHAPGHRGRPTGATYTGPRRMPEAPGREAGRADAAQSTRSGADPTSAVMQPRAHGAWDVQERLAGIAIIDNMK